MRIILHLDFDSFFASVEKQYDARLRGKPVGVLAAHGQTAVIAACYQAKRYGIRTPTRTYEAKLLCPDIIFVKADFEKYARISRQFVIICKDYSPLLEIFSIDELFLDITPVIGLWKSIDELVSHLKQRIAKEIGDYITVSVGIAENKSLAKLASSLNKPDGIGWITQENLDQVYSRLSLSAICGIGYRIEKRLNVLGVRTLLQLRQIPVGILQKEFGTVVGSWLSKIGHGKDDRPVIPYTVAPPVKSLSRQYCLEENEYDMKRVQVTVFELCESLSLKLRKLDKKAQIFGLALKGSIQLSEHHTKLQMIDTGADMFQLCKRWFDEWQESLSRQYVRRIAVWATDLVEASSVPQSLFAENRRKDNLTKAIDAINAKFGRYTVRNGMLWKTKKLPNTPNGFGNDNVERVNLAQNTGE